MATASGHVPRPRSARPGPGVGDWVRVLSNTASSFDVSFFSSKTRDMARRLAYKSKFNGSRFAGIRQTGSGAYDNGMDPNQEGGMLGRHLNLANLAVDTARSLMQSGGGPRTRRQAWLEQYPEEEAFVPPNVAATPPPPLFPNAVDVIEHAPIESIAEIAPAVASTSSRAKRPRKPLPSYKASDAVYLSNFKPRNYSSVIKTKDQMSAAEYADRQNQLAVARTLRTSNRKPSRNTPLDHVMREVGVARKDGHTSQTKLLPWKIGNNSEPKPGLYNDVLRLGIITAANDYKNRGPITKMVKASVPTESLRNVVRRERRD